MSCVSLRAPVVCQSEPLVVCQFELVENTHDNQNKLKISTFHLLETKLIYQQTEKNNYKIRHIKIHIILFLSKNQPRLIYIYKKIIMNKLFSIISRHKKLFFSSIIILNIILLSIIIYAYLQLYKKPDTENLATNNTTITQNQQVKKEQQNVSKCQDGWTHYKHDILGIEFCYPENEWGKVSTEPISNITNLKKLIAESSYYNSEESKSNSYYNLIKFEFENSGYPKTFEIRLLKNTTNLEDCANCDKNITNLRTTKNICKYSLNNSEKNIQEVYNNCQNNIKTTITEKSDLFTSSWKYSYSLSLFSFINLDNNYFDDAVIEYTFNCTQQLDTKANINSIDDFFALQNSPIDQNNFNSTRSNFEKFIKSIKIFKPSTDFSQYKADMSNLSGDAQIIANYYWLLTTKDFENAYKINTEGLSYQKFLDKYKNLYAVTPFNFQMTGDKKYRFLLKYQGQNTDIKNYQIEAQIKNSQFTITSEMLLLTDTGVPKRIEQLRVLDKRLVVSRKCGSK